MRQRTLVISLLAVAACAGDRPPRRLGDRADTAALVLDLEAAPGLAPETVGAGLAKTVLAHCGAACGCLGSALVVPDAAAPACPAANPTVPPQWPPMELAGRYLAEQVALTKLSDRARLLDAMAAIRVPIPRVDPTRWALVAASRHRPLSSTQVLIGLGRDAALWVAPMPVARFDARGAHIDEAPDGLVGVAPPTDADLRTAVDQARGLVPDPPPPDDDAAARQRAIDLARSAGVLGDPALGSGDAFATLVDPADPAVIGGLLGTLDDDAVGGFGLGPAGGTGWGTIGTGRYGTIGGGRSGSLGVGGIMSTRRETVGGEVGAALPRGGPLVAADGAAPAMRLVEVLGPHGGALAVSAGGTPRELPIVFGPGAGGIAPAAHELTLASDGLGLVTADGITRRWPITNGRYDVAAVQAALATPGAPAPTVALVLEGGTVADLVGLVDLALGAGASRVRITAIVQVDRPSGLRSARSAVPQVRIGQPQSVGDLDKAIIRRYIKRHLAKIAYCYEKQLLARPDLEGTVTTQFFIAPTGDVSSANAAGLDPEVATCVARVIKGIEFPRPRGGGGVQVNYPFIFHPTGG